MQGYGAMSLTEFAQPVIAPNAEATLRHVLESGVSVLNTAGVHNLPCCIPDLLARMRAASTSFCIIGKMPPCCVTPAWLQVAL